MLDMFNVIYFKLLNAKRE